MDYQSLIDQYYPVGTPLRFILMEHSRSVAHKALAIVDTHPQLQVDRQFVHEAAMLHDIGIFLTHAPGIECHGTEPYICHGILGAALMRKDGLERYARVCERRTGTGLTLQQIIEQQLPLPHQDFWPETMEEKIICYADKFYSKTHLDAEKTVEQARRSIMKFGKEGVARFDEWVKIFD
jgi:uncharacterized protein